MILDALWKSIDQISDPKFRRVFFLGTGLALVLYAAIFLLVGAILPTDFAPTGVDWLDTLIAWVLGTVFLVVLFLLFPAVATMTMGLFLEDVADAVEARHYPNHRASRKIGIAEALFVSLRLGIVILLANIAALPLYVLLLFTGIGPYILYFLLNAYLLGREYFELVAGRHLPPQQVNAARRSRRDLALLAGIAITILFIVPVVNLAAPILATAMMVHLFHEGFETGKAK